MSPTFSENDVVNVLKTHSESDGQISLIKDFEFPKSANLSHIIFCENMLRMLFSSSYRMLFRPCSFFNRIKSIILFCSQPKVFWVYARRIIFRRTIVKNAQSFWNWSSMNNPRSKMSPNALFGWSSTCDISIPKRTFASSPNPTFFSFPDFGPESFWKRFGKSLRSKILGCNLRHIRLVCADWVTGPSALLFSHIATK